ncbi:hypothetical protein BJF93_17975 [Xaviernesmea oryzae]|uniref:Uncharacterized protein n=1 Tax=Xaviernesmea oryzae TaxID=464029 RepID=A0A1Q9ATG5_9HYPH|nr:plant virulence effector HPE1-like domain-containing protein [Xaviernesmea oryzae]OLP58710.1 hypothetical protein BJF93_17975 [Xaviernesmea oryzae]
MLIGLLSPGPAAAGSIDVIGADGLFGNHAVVQIRCDTCRPEAPRAEKRLSYIVPDMGGDEERLEMRRIHGEIRLVRTEAWLGGSPILFVSRPTPEAVTAFLKARNRLPGNEFAGAEGIAPSVDLAEGDAVDRLSTTAALSPVAADLVAAAAVPDSSTGAQAAASQDFDGTGFQLRLN